MNTVLKAFGVPSLSVKTVPTNLYRPLTRRTPLHSRKRMVRAADSLRASSYGFARPFTQSAEGAALPMNSVWASRIGRTLVSFSARLTDIDPAQHLRNSLPFETF